MSGNLGVFVDLKIPRTMSAIELCAMAKSIMEAERLVMQVGLLGEMTIADARLQRLVALCEAGPTFMAPIPSSGTPQVYAIANKSAKMPRLL